MRRSIIFHHLMPKELVYLMESCSFFVTICVEQINFPDFPESPFTWNEIDYSRRIALGSDVQSNFSTGKNPSILTSDSNLIIPQSKNVKLLFKQSSSHGYVIGGFTWNLTRYCQLAIGRPFEGLKFAVHGTTHTENDVLAIQNLCPTEVELTSWNEFGTVRAGGYLQWRNMAAVFEGSTLDLNSLPVAVLFLQAAYQVGPLPAYEHWTFDLTETPFVRLLLEHIASAAERIRDNWSAHRVLFVCISICTYVVQRVSPEMTEKGLQVLELCRQISIQWSSSVESLIAAVASKSVVDEDYIRALFYVNSLIVLTFKVVEEPTSEELFQLLRARAIMYEKRYLPRDAELERLAILCSRIMASHEELVHGLIIKFDCSPLTLVAKDRFPQGQVSSWTRCSSSDVYQSTCSTEYSTNSVIHFNVFDGTFLVDGEPIGCLSDGILKHHLFKKNFPLASLPVLHRGGGVYETTGLKEAVYTFALVGSSLVAKERRNGRSSRLIDVQAFNQDLPQPLISAHSFWMTYDGLEHYIELRRPNMFQISDYRPIYRIELNSHLDGQVMDLDARRLLLNYRGQAFDTVFKSFLWRLDDRSFIVPFLPRQSEPEDADQWTLCLRLHRLHQHVEIHCSEDSVKVQVREFENMSVSADQFLGTFIGLEHLLVLERPNGIRTVIVPHLDYTTELVGPHLKLKPKSLTPNAVIPFFSFDEDRWLKQMRPHGSETMVSWLMCCYLHGITSSAMMDPLTQLTGLEMAIAQLRRCYSTKPFDNLGYDILAKISQLSVDRSAVDDTEIVQWDERRPSYSSSEVYKLLVHLIHSKSALFMDN